MAFYSGHSGTKMNNGKYQLKQMFSWSKNLKNGPWTNEEHLQFIKCLKIHGIDWPKLKEMIPTRTRHQIKSHQRRYFYQIKKHFGLDDPMEYILNNKCDNLRFYKNGRTENEVNKVYQDSDVSQIPKNIKKRDIKYSEKKEEEEFGLEKLFKIQKVERQSLKLIKQQLSDRLRTETTKGESYQASQTSFTLKGQKEVVENKSFLVLADGSLMIPGEIIKSNVPCIIQKINSGISLIHPQQNVSVTIQPISNGSLSIYPSGTSSGSVRSMRERMDSTGSIMQSCNISQNYNSYISNEASECNLALRAIELLSPYYCIE